MCYMSLPAKATLLQTIENSRCGRALCKHVHGAVRNAAGPARSATALRRAADRNLRLEKEDQDKPLQSHPIVKRHRESGRPSLFVNPSHTVGIEGWEDSPAVDL